jgi:Flp pilus assembly protein TadD
MRLNRIAAAAAGLAICLAWAAGSETERAEEPQYKQAVAAIKAHQYERAIQLLQAHARRTKPDADVHNYLGYAYRKSGKLDAAFDHYGKALALDARHLGAHEYIGEAYLMVNDLPKAEEHLQALHRLCAASCEEYRDLQKAIADHKARKQ